MTVNNYKCDYCKNYVNTLENNVTINNTELCNKCSITIYCSNHCMILDKHKHKNICHIIKRRGLKMNYVLKSAINNFDIIAALKKIQKPSNALHIVYNVKTKKLKLHTVNIPSHVNSRSYIKHRTTEGSLAYVIIKYTANCEVIAKYFLTDINGKVNVEFNP